MRNLWLKKFVCVVVFVVCCYYCCDILPDHSHVLRHQHQYQYQYRSVVLAAAAATTVTSTPTPLARTGTLPPGNDNDLSISHISALLPSTTPIDNYEPVHLGVQVMSDVSCGCVCCVCVCVLHLHCIQPSYVSYAYYVLYCMSTVLNSFLVLFFTHMYFCIHTHIHTCTRTHTHTHTHTYV